MRTVEKPREILSPKSMSYAEQSVALMYDSNFERLTTAIFQSYSGP